jgi:predicted nucleotidyltransferase component of viral defense system
MTHKSVTNLPASVRQRLLNLSRERQEDFNLVLSLYAIERLLYRLAQSPYAGQFVLKGAVLFAVWTGRLHRPTHDLDLLGYGDDSAQTLTRIFQAICQTDVTPDGLEFDPDNIHVAEIREGQVYGGQRIMLSAALGAVRITVQIDIGFGDAVTPAASLMTYLTLLSFPAPALRVYPKEVVVAEKLHAMVIHGLLNSRVKDFYDLWVLSQQFVFAGDAVVMAITATFERRHTALPVDLPLTLTPDFGNHPNKRTQWLAFLSRSDLHLGAITFPEIVAALAQFFASPLAAANAGAHLQAHWPVGWPWEALVWNT